MEVRKESSLGPSGVAPGREEAFLTALFAELARSGIDYAVLRNYESLPHSLGGSDLDIGVPSRSASSALQAAVERCARHAGGAAIGIGRAQSLTMLSVLGCTGEGDWWGARVDIFVGLRFRGHEYADFAAVEKADWRGVRVVDREVSDLLSSVKELLHNGEVPVRYEGGLRRLLDEEGQRADQVLAPLGEDCRAALRKLVSSSGKVRDSSFGARFLRHRFRVAPLQSVRDAATERWARYRRFLKPSGKIIAVLGVDGAGKSTLIEGILPQINAATHNAVKVLHLRPGLLPPLASFARRRNPGRPNDEAITDPHGRPPSGVPASLFRLAYLLTDYVLGYWIRIRPFIARQPSIVLFDRYAYDLWLDPLRFRLKLPAALLRRAALCMPTPDLVLCLTGSPELIQVRKKEISIAETARQIASLSVLANDLTRSVVIQSDTGPSSAINQALAQLLDKLQHRQG